MDPLVLLFPNRLHHLPAFIISFIFQGAMTVVDKQYENDIAIAKERLKEAKVLTEKELNGMFKTLIKYQFTKYECFTLIYCSLLSIN